MNAKLKRAVAVVVRAEWYFRCGPRAYRDKTQEQFEKSMARLRRALTGRGELDAAFKLLPPPVSPSNKR